MFFNTQIVDHASNHQVTPADLVYLMQRDSAFTVATNQPCQPLDCQLLLTVDCVVTTNAINTSLRQDLRQQWVSCDYNPHISFNPRFSQPETSALSTYNIYHLVHGVNRQIWTSSSRGKALSLMGDKVCTHKVYAVRVDTRSSPHTRACIRVIDFHLAQRLAYIPSTCTASRSLT
jgi:hypothetical protein